MKTQIQQNFMQLDQLGKPNSLVINSLKGINNGTWGFGMKETTSSISDSNIPMGSVKGNGTTLERLLNSRDPLGGSSYRQLSYKGQLPALR